MKYGFNWPSCYSKEMYENNGHIHVYIFRTGTDSPQELSYFHKQISSLNLTVCSMFPIIKSGNIAQVQRQTTLQDQIFS